LLLGITFTASAYRGGNGRFVASPHNPVIPVGELGNWDAVLFEADVLYEDGTFHLFHSTMPAPFSFPVNIGYATSTDGIHWTRPVDAPVMAVDGTGFDAADVSGPTVIKEGDIWIMYYGGKSAPPVLPNGLQIGRATAPAPQGPWTRLEEPVLTTGSPGEWDSGLVNPEAVIPLKQGYMLFYSGGADFLAERNLMVGVAFSRDGITWRKYNNPRTHEAPYAESDPILMFGEPGSWDDYAVWLVDVLKTDHGWEMFYTAGGSNYPWSIGHAYSYNGILWHKDPHNPVLTIWDDPVTPSGVLLEAPSVVDVAGERLMFYDYGRGGPGIGLAERQRQLITDNQILLLWGNGRRGTAVSNYRPHSPKITLSPSKFKL